MHVDPCALAKRIEKQIVVSKDVQLFLSRAETVAVGLN